jgi:glycosyltransferase involved in cell wall biosynthesis
MFKKESFEYLGDTFEFSGYLTKKPPKVSILISTFNRKNLLERCLKKIYRQSFKDYEIIVFDDYSSDETNKFLKEEAGAGKLSFVRGLQNVAGRKGDRHLINIFLKKFCRGEYFGYSCDDDYWIYSDLLKEQIALLENHPNAAMVVGSQLTCSLLDPKDDGPDINEDTLNKYLNKDLECIDPRLYFFKDLYPSFMSSDEFIKLDAKKPLHNNINIGATLYRKSIFLKSKTLQSKNASKWQAGWELRNGPGAFGDVLYINKPCLYVEARPTNASFTKTQLEHYKDSIKSIKLSFDQALRYSFPSKRYFFLTKYKRVAMLSVCQSYLRQTIIIKSTGSLTMCTDDNLASPVLPRHVIFVLLRHFVPIKIADFWMILFCSLPDLLFRAYQRRSTKGDKTSYRMGKFYSYIMNNGIEDN